MQPYDSRTDWGLPLILPIPAPAWVVDRRALEVHVMLGWYRFNDEGPYVPMTTTGVIHDYTVFWSADEAGECLDGMLVYQNRAG